MHLQRFEDTGRFFQTSPRPWYLFPGDLLHRLITQTLILGKFFLQFRKQTFTIAVNLIPHDPQRFQRSGFIQMIQASEKIVVQQFFPQTFR